MSLSPFESPRHEVRGVGLEGDVAAVLAQRREAALAVTRDSAQAIDAADAEDPLAPLNCCATKTSFSPFVSLPPGRTWSGSRRVCRRRRCPGRSCRRRTPRPRPSWLTRVVVFACRSRTKMSMASFVVACDEIGRGRLERDVPSVAADGRVCSRSVTPPVSDTSTPCEVSGLEVAGRRGRHCGRPAGSSRSSGRRRTGRRR